MKKNKMMRLASGLLVAVLITTSTISGTFAKYVTEDSATDKARVAKFGVVVTADGTLFGKTYLDATDNTPGEGTEAAADISVKSLSDDNVVAPGTKNGAKPIAIAITGQPEVDVKVSIEFASLDEFDNDIYLEKGKYANVTTANDKTDILNLDKKYEPVKYTLKKDGVAVTGVENVNLATLRNALKTAFTQDYIAAGTDLKTVFGTTGYTIEWAWAFGTEGAPSGNDAADTYLGNLAAGAGIAGAYVADPADPDVVTSPVEGTNYNLKTGLDFTIRVEQLD